MTFTTPSITFPIIGFVIGVLIVLLSILCWKMRGKYKFQMFFGILLIALNGFSVTRNLSGVITISAGNIPVQEPKVKRFGILIDKAQK